MNIRRMAICISAGLCAVVAAGGLDTTRGLLEQKLLTDSGVMLSRCVYDEVFNRVVRADRICDANWTGLDTPQELKAFQDCVRRRAIEALGGFPERTPLNSRTTGTLMLGSCRVEKVLFESRPGFYVTGHLYVPLHSDDKGPFPALLVSCGHSFAGKSAPAYSNTGVFGAERGFVVFVYDPIDQGERYQKRDERDDWSCTCEHNNMGVRAFLLGESAAQVRIFDGMRAIDYLVSRTDIVRPDQIAVAGISGGGTLSSYINAFDPRVACAAPSGFLSTIRDVYDNCGPQDAEQIIFGQLTYGLNHLGIVCLRAPSPILVSASHSDFFPYMGTEGLVENARKVFATARAEDHVNILAVPGAHHWYTSQKDVQLRWMSKWMKGNVDSYTQGLAAPYRNYIGYDYKDGRGGLADESLEKRNVTPHGRVLEISGARSIYDIYREKLAELTLRRSPLSREAVRQLTGIRKPDEISLSRRAVKGGFVLFRGDDQTMIPVVSLVSIKRSDKPPVLIVSDVRAREQLSKTVNKFLEEGRDVFVADIRGFGETSSSRHDSNGRVDGDREIAKCMMALGDSLVARRAEDIMLVAQILGRDLGQTVVLWAEGRAVVPAVHANYLEPDLFADLVTSREPESWSEVLADEAIEYPFSCLIRGALALYDWTDLKGRGKLK